MAVHANTAAGGETRPPSPPRTYVLIERRCVMQNLSLNDFMGLMLLLITFATLVLKIYDNKKH